MRAVTWHGRRNVSVDTVPDPQIKEPTDAIIRVTSTNICGSDLHLYEVLGAFMSPGTFSDTRPWAWSKKSATRSLSSKSVTAW